MFTKRDLHQTEPCCNSVDIICNINCCLWSKPSPCIWWHHSHSCSGHTAYSWCPRPHHEQLHWILLQKMFHLPRLLYWGHHWEHPLARLFHYFAQSVFLPLLSIPPVILTHSKQIRINARSCWNKLIAKFLFGRRSDQSFAAAAPTGKRESSEIMSIHLPPPPHSEQRPGPVWIWPLWCWTPPLRL